MLQHRRNISRLHGAFTFYTEVQIFLLDQPKDLKSIVMNYSRRRDLPLIPSSGSKM